MTGQKNINKRPKSLRWIILMHLHTSGGTSGLDSKPAHPAKLGAAPLKFVRRNINYQVVSFDDLYFNYLPRWMSKHPDGNITKGTKKPMIIPRQIEALNGQKVAIKGFVIPLANSEGQTTKEFYLLTNWFLVCFAQC